MLTEWQTANARNDRERNSRVRQNAEDLFKPRQQTVHVDAPTSAPDAASSAGQQPRRQPRIFAIPSPMSMREAKVEPETVQKQIQGRPAIRREIREIPTSQHGRVRALTSYGMTREQVAELYGVTVDEVERIMKVRRH